MMKNLYMVIGKSELLLYEREDDKFNKQYIDGNPGFSYELRNIENSISELLEALVNENNLESKNELGFTLIRDANDRVGGKVESCIADYINDVIILEEIVEDYIHKAATDPLSMIDEYGINYYDNNYIIKDGKVIKSDFDLLGLTVNTDSLMEVLKK